MRHYCWGMLTCLQVSEDHYLEWRWYYLLLYYYCIYFLNISKCNVLNKYYGTYLTDYNELFLLLWIPGEYSSWCEVKSSLTLWLSDWRSTLFTYAVFIIIMSCHQHGYPWPSLATPPYHSSLLAGLQGYIPYSHVAALCMFELVVLLFLGHMRGSIGVHHWWVHPCFSSSVLHVWFVELG